MSLKPRPRTPPAPKLLQATEFEGLYRLITFADEDGAFKIVTFRTGDGEEFKAAGNFYGSAKGEPLRIRGAWKEHAQYGWTFQVESYIQITPTSEDGMLAYLGSGLIKGVRASTAKKIIDHFGEKTLEVLDKAPELLREVKGVSKNTIHKIVEQWNAQKEMREATIFLKSVGLTNAIALRLLKHYGEGAAAILRTNPYRAGMEVSHIGFVKADEIAAKMGISRDSPFRIQAAFVHILDQASGEGHTFLPRLDLLERANKLLDQPAELVVAGLDDAVAKRFLVRAAVADEAECYFIPSLYKCETGVAHLALDLIRNAHPLVHGSIDAKIQDFETQYRFQLAPQQQDALRSVAAGGVCVITGGPGTGKTTLVRALLHVMKGEKIRFALCSPTGRAAQRLAETTREEAATIHRLLKWNAQTGRFTHGPDNRLPIELLIVDEASMLDIPLAFNLLRALPSRATVVFVGDVDQLPSVGPGAFLRNLIDSGRARTTRLEIIFRQAQASLIIRNSHRINEGHGLIFPEGDEKNSDFYFIARDEPEKIREAMLAMATNRIPARLGMDAVDAVQVLSPMRRGPLGTIELNAVLQAELNPRGRRLFETYPFRIGDKVIQVSNNYDLDVYNGDVGKITGANAETQLVQVAFGKRVVSYPYESLNELELAYAITIHKSQGSEYPAAIVLLHSSHFIMLKRNLLYTAVTRGKKLVVVIGNKQSLFRAIRTSTESERKTALAFWLRHPSEKSGLLE